jgi:hypothetical protein
MSIQTENLKGIDAISAKDLLRPFEHGIKRDDTYQRTSAKPIDWIDQEKAQMRDQIEMLEREVDRQETIIDALVKAIKVIERN